MESQGTELVLTINIKSKDGTTKTIALANIAKEKEKDNGSNTPNNDSERSD